MPVSFLGPARLRAASPSDAPEALSGLGRGALGRGEERRTQLRGGGGAKHRCRGGPEGISPPGSRARGELTEKETQGEGDAAARTGLEGLPEEMAAGLCPEEKAGALRKSKDRKAAARGASPGGSRKVMVSVHCVRPGRTVTRTRRFVPPVTRFSQKQSLPTFPGPPAPMPGPTDTDKDQTRP